MGNAQAPASLARTQCPACNAAYRREALALLMLLIQHSPAGVWPPRGIREAVGEVNNDPDPCAWVRCFRSTLHDDGVCTARIPAAQRCAECEALACAVLDSVEPVAAWQPGDEGACTTYPGERMASKRDV